VAAPRIDAGEAPQARAVVALLGVIGSALTLAVVAGVGDAREVGGGIGGLAPGVVAELALLGARACTPADRASEGVVLGVAGVTQPAAGEDSSGGPVVGFDDVVGGVGF